jgi:MoxR-like ATPase
MTSPAAPDSTLGLAEVHAAWEKLRQGLDRVVLGQAKVKEELLLCLLAGGHGLIEGVPGTGKTLLALALSRLLGCQFRRIQFTPDLMPIDLLGTNVFDQKRQDFAFVPGPVFTEVLLADEVNRTPPRTQSALLEAMQEGQVTVDNVTHFLPSPFLVIATQNPVEHEGTYPLPESQLDRFLLRIRMGYPDRNAEVEMLDVYGRNALQEDLPVVAGEGAIPAMVALAHEIHVATAIKGYIVDLATATRDHPALALGMSPRAALALQRAARAYAASESREYVIPDDVKALLGPVVEHRLMLSPEAVVSGVELPEVLAEVLRSVPVPTGRGGI